MAVGSLPNTEAIGLEKVGVKTNDAGFIDVDKVSRTSVRGVYAAGDCTGVMMLASVAAMQGRIAMWHALGDAELAGAWEIVRDLQMARIAHRGLVA
jgi:dihydrolipoamide dehydrogenase